MERATAIKNGSAGIRKGFAASKETETNTPVSVREIWKATTFVLTMIRALTTRVRRLVNAPENSGVFPIRVATCLEFAWILA